MVVIVDYWWRGLWYPFAAYLVQVHLPPEASINPPVPVLIMCCILLHVLLVAVRFGAWVKRTFSLKPALERIRERRPEARSPEKVSFQVDRMR